jgi:catecholate siderophore receptor
MKSGRRNKRKAISEKTCWPVSYRWLAIGTLAMYTAIGSKTVNVAMAQSPGNAPGTGAASDAGAIERRYDIPAGLMGNALDVFQERSGIKVAVALSGLRDLQSPGVAGSYTAEQAITQIVKGTGVVWHFTGPNEMLLEPQKVTISVDVNERANSVAQSLTETPQTISVVPQAIMEQQNATTLRDTLRNVAGISIAAGEGGSQGDNLTIRGFTARNDLFIDGMRDFGSYYRDPFDLQEVEVLQGPSSVTFGRGSTGGVVNQAAKTTTPNRFFNGEFDGGTDATRRITADFNTPVKAFGEGAAFRVNVMGTEANVAGRDVAETRRFGVAPTLSLGMGTATRWTFNYLHQTADDIPDYGIPWLFNQPAPVNRSNYYGFKEGNFLRTYDDIGTARVEHDFNRHFSVRNQARYANYIRNVQITEPQVLSPSLTTPLSALKVNRNQLAAYSTESFLADQLDFSMNFDTGHIHHVLTAGLEADRERSNPLRPKYTNVTTTSLLDPNENDVFAGTPAPSSDVHATADTTSEYFLYTAKLGKKWDVTGGLRWDRFSAHYTQGVPPASAFNRVDYLMSYRAAVVYKPVQGGSIYVAVGTSSNPSAESLSLSAANANLPPEENRTFEAGTKWDFMRNKLSVTAALFDTTKTNAREPDPTNALLNVLAGNQRVIGAQVGVEGHVTRRWEILTSYARLNSEVMSSNFYPLSVGAQLANVPRNTFNAWNNFRLPGRIQMGFGGNYVASRTASSTVPLDPITGLVKAAPSYWVFNAMASRSINDHVSLQANVYNIANRYYYDQLHPGHVVLGVGRSALVALRFRF